MQFLNAKNALLFHLTLKTKTFCDNDDDDYVVVNTT